MSDMDNILLHLCSQPTPPNMVPIVFYSFIYSISNLPDTFSVTINCLKGNSTCFNLTVDHHVQQEGDHYTALLCDNVERAKRNFMKFADCLMARYQLLNLPHCDALASLRFLSKAS